MLDQGAWDEVLTLTGEDADNLKDLLVNTSTLYYNVERRALMFGTTKMGE